MKKLLITLMLCISTVSQADTVGWQSNNGGGKIVLTDNTCKADARQFMAYTSSTQISTQFGCWFSDDTMVHITWENSGNFKSYPLEDWNLNMDVIKKLRQRLKGNSNGYTY